MYSQFMMRGQKNIKI